MVEYHKSPRTAYNTLEVEQGMESHFKPPLALKEHAVLAAPAAVKAGLSKAIAILKGWNIKRNTWELTLSVPLC